MTAAIDPIETALLVVRQLDALERRPDSSGHAVEDREYLRDGANILGVSDLLERALGETRPER